MVGETTRYSLSIRIQT